MSNKRLVIATRGSRLALWQAEHVRDRILAVDPDRLVELEVIKTLGDKILDKPLAKIGGKALFVKEIEQALLDGEADLAVHSMKDVPADETPGLSFAAVSKREDPTDAICARPGASLSDPALRVGTSSLRRMCQLRAVYPSLTVLPLRGNVPTRLDKLERGDFDAVVLASAGLVRLGFADRITQRLAIHECLPAVGQGALGIQVRSDDSATAELVRKAVHHASDAMRIHAERSFLGRLDGGCQTPMAAHAIYDGDDLVVSGLVGRPDGSEILRARSRGPAAEAAVIGDRVAVELLEQGAQRLLDECALA